MELTSVVLLTGAVACMVWWRFLSGERRNVVFIMSVVFALAAAMCCGESGVAALSIIGATLLVAVYVVFHEHVYHVWFESGYFRIDNHQWMGSIRSAWDIWKSNHQHF